VRGGMFVSDLDGTLLGDATATQAFVDWWRRHWPFHRLVYTSGRSIESVMESIKEWNLPFPDAVVTSVGTEIYYLPEMRHCMEWHMRWWPKWSASRIATLLDGRSELELQPPECQATLKRSYFIRNASVEWLRQIRHLLLNHNLQADVIYSSNRDLDVVPAGASKGAAAEFLAQKWNVSRSEVIVAGDSGNDLSLFFRGYRGIIVANAQRELKELRGPLVLHSSESYAYGVLDGLDYWFQRGRAAEASPEIQDPATDDTKAHTEQAYDALMSFLGVLRRPLA
jgi:sucrose-6F-phosphate phosphohydrolase